MSEVNLIGGFYLSKARPWSAQDVVNWVPVKSLSGGTRSPYKLRGLPGLKPLTIDVPPVPAGDWIIFWSVGAGNTAYYLTVPDPQSFDMAGGQLIGVSAEISGTSFAGGSLFVSTGTRGLLRATDKDGPFTALTLSTAGPTAAGRVAPSATSVVYGAGSGEAQYSSNNGTSWIRSTGEAVEWVAADSDGALVGFDVAQPRARVSSNNGGSFGLGGTPSLPSFTNEGGLACDGETFIRIVSAAAGGLYATRSTDAGATWSAGVLLPIGDTARDEPIVGNSILSPSLGVFYVMSAGGIMCRSVDSGATWLTGIDTGLSAVRGWAVGGGLIVAAGQSSAPNEGVAVSSDGGATWSLATVANPPPDFDFDSVAFFPA